MTLQTFFSGGYVDRAGAVRTSTVRLDAALKHDTTRFVALWESQCLIENDAAVLLTRAELGIEPTLSELVYLGTRSERHLFACALPAALPAQAPAAERFGNFRALLGGVSAADGHLLAYAKGMLEWRRRHQHCGVCGAPNVSEQGGFVMLCSQPDCAQRCFPRVDPAIIVLVTRGDQCLLGRQQSWPAGRFSTIAGFVEPGESLEDAVRREVAEETNIEVGAAHYLGSQPWPFPQAMMIGFHAEGSSTAIALNDAELAEAHWFSRTELAAGKVRLPPPTSIAFRLIEAWFDQWDGAPLAALDLSTDFRSG